MHMSLALWFAAAALALLFAATGVMKLFESREMLVADGQRWAASVSPTFIRALGAPRSWVRSAWCSPASSVSSPR